MKWAIALLTLAVMLPQGGTTYPWEPPWGPSSPEPPPGWFCTPKGYVKDGVQTDEHPCTCEHMGYSDGGEGEGCEPAHPPATCKTYCKSEACGCPVLCPDEKGHP